MFAPGSAESEAGLHPWNSPGAAPTYGDGCGLNGGNPDGCEGEGGGAHSPNIVMIAAKVR